MIDWIFGSVNKKISSHMRVLVRMLALEVKPCIKRTYATLRLIASTAPPDSRRL
jgi:hypothetical protein